jgi:hypothetical protein
MKMISPSNREVDVGHWAGLSACCFEYSSLVCLPPVFLQTFLQTAR